MSTKHRWFYFRQISFVVLLFGIAAILQLQVNPDSYTITVPTPRWRVTPSVNDQVWIIPGQLNATHHLTGTFESNADGSAIFLQVGGLWPFSPSSRARSIYLEVDCLGKSDQWYYEGFSFDSHRSRSENFSCGDAVSILFSYDANYHWLVFEAAEEYSLTATVHGPS